MSNDANSLIRKPQSSAMSPQLMDVDQGQRQPFESESPQHPHKPANALLVLHSLLRGRYWLAITLAILLGGIGAPVGYKAVKPIYQAKGMIRIATYQQSVLYTSPRSDVIPYFDQYMDAQVALMRNPEMIRQAMNDPQWAELGLESSSDVADAFLENVDITRSGELITINFADDNPNTTYRGVNALIDAFDAYFNRIDSNSMQGRMSQLEARERELDVKLHGLNAEILSMGQQWSATSLEPMLKIRQESLGQIDRELTMIRLTLAAAQSRMGNTAGTPTQLDSPEDLLRRYTQKRDEVLGAMEQLRLKYGANHEQVVAEQARLDQLETAIKAVWEQIQRGQGGNNVLAVTNLNALRQNEAVIAKYREQVDTELQELGKKNVVMEAKRQEANDVRAQLEEAKTALEHLRVEGTVPGRLSVIYRAEKPRGTFKDRRKSLAAAGGLGGAALGVAIVALWGLLDGRMRQIADARSQLPKFSKLLGVLPSLPDNLSDPDQSAIAAHCVHQIRTLLQIQQGVSGHRVLAVTSPSPGDGKTSLTIALGLSFAASGAKTLLIDCDMYGRRLTARLTSSGVRKLGQILLYNRRISDEQLSQALERARCAGRKLGETLIDMHAVNEKDVAHALGVQARMDAGLFGAIRGDQMADCVLRTGVSNLHLMPLGTDDPRQAALITPVAIRPILDEAARQFDVVLVDTGPILGSPEAAVIASEVDGVVLTISRGGQRTLAQNAVNYLNSMNAHLEGIVFNRARPDDILRSGYSSSVSMSPGETDKHEKTYDATSAAGAAPWPKRLGPVAHAVSSESPTVRPPGDEKNT